DFLVTDKLAKVLLDNRLQMSDRVLDNVPELQIVGLEFVPIILTDPKAFVSRLGVFCRLAEYAQRRQRRTRAREEPLIQFDARGNQRDLHEHHEIRASGKIGLVSSKPELPVCLSRTGRGRALSCPSGGASLHLTRSRLRFPRYRRSSLRQPRP